MAAGETGDSIDFLFTDEQLELRATVRAFLADKSPEETVRRLMATEAGYDPGVWKQISEHGRGVPGVVPWASRAGRMSPA